MGKTCYEFIDRETNRPCSVKVIIDEYTYNTLCKAVSGVTFLIQVLVIMKTMPRMILMDILQLD